MTTDDDRNRVIAAADLVGRAGARKFEIGYLHDDVPADEAGWYAFAQFRGARITCGDQPSPSDAAEGLARKLLTGARCRCGRLVAMEAAGAVAFRRPVMADGSAWTAKDAAAAGQCLWTRTGDRWDPSCDAPPVMLPGPR